MTLFYKKISLFIDIFRDFILHRAKACAMIIELQ